MLKTTAQLHPQPQSSNSLQVMNVKGRRVKQKNTTRTAPDLPSVEDEGGGVNRALNVILVASENLTIAR
jgi:hypothetical protein